jgi:hypothetical protein
MAPGEKRGAAARSAGSIAIRTESCRKPLRDASKKTKKCPALNALIFVLTSIRDQADSVLRKIDKPRSERSLAWKCTRCGQVKHFTRPALAEVSAPCPKCGGGAFNPI